MKKLFTLIAGMLLIGSGAFAQDKWTTITTNGNMEGEQSPDWSSFWCHDWREVTEGEELLGGGQQRDSNGQFQGFAEIVEDPIKPGNHCARVIIRSKEEADAAGNTITDAANGKPDWAEWDSQFFIYATETIPQGKEVRLIMKVSAEKAGNLQTQAHYNPGNYNHWQLFGDIEYTTEWKQIEVTQTITADMTQETNGKAFQSVAFNLSTMRDGNVIYFDDVRLQVRDPQENEEPEFTGWFNFLRNGINSADKFKFSNGTFTNFTGRDGSTGKDQPARIVNDPLDGQPALNVTSICYNSTYQKEEKTEILDGDGQPVLDEDGNPTYEISYTELPCYIKENGDTLKKQDGSIGIDDWQTQFFVATPHVFKNGEKFRFVISVRADKETTIQTQIHRGPGDYLHYQLLGDINVTTEWETYIFEQAIDGSQAGGSTFAFNCNVLKEEVNNYYFRIDEISINAASATDDDRTLMRKSISLPVPALEKDVNVKIDLSEMMEILRIENLTEFLNDNTLKATVKKVEGEGDEEDVTVSLMGGLQATTGIFINDIGSWIDDDQGINIYFPEEGISGNEATINIGNFAETEFTPGNTIQTVICFEKDHWMYAFDVTLMDPAAYEAQSGITDVKVTKNGNGAIYDLSGRKVTAPAKGLYIKDGKKFIMK